MFRAFWAAPLLVAFAVAPALAAPVFDERGCATAYEPGTDYFGAKSEVEYAANFSVAYFDHYKVVTVAQPYPGGARESYVLVQCGTPEPELGPDLAGAQHITVPVHSLFSGGTSQSPALVALGEVGAVTGVAQRDLIATPELIEHMQDQPVVEYAGSGVVNIEAVVAAAPGQLCRLAGNLAARACRMAQVHGPVLQCRGQGECGLQRHCRAL
jgi:iron complex transport system substrate-binding protein